MGTWCQQSLIPSWGIGVEVGGIYHDGRLTGELDACIDYKREPGEAVPMAKMPRLASAVKGAQSGLSSDYSS